MSAPNESLDQLLSGYLDDALSDDQRRRVEDRLRADPEAASELESLRSLRATLRALSEQDAPRSLGPEFAERVIESAVARARVEGLSEDHPLVRLSEQPTGVALGSQRVTPRRLIMTVAAVAASILVAFFSVQILEDGSREMIVADGDPIQGENRVPSDRVPNDRKPGDGDVAGRRTPVPGVKSDRTDGLADSDRNQPPDGSDRFAGDSLGADDEPTDAERAGKARPGTEMSPGDTESANRPMIADSNPGSDSNPESEAIPRSRRGDALPNVGDNVLPGGTQAILVLDVRRTETGQASLAVRRAIERAGIGNAGRGRADEETVGMVTDAVSPEGGFDGTVLYLEGPAKRLDRFVTGLVDDESGIASVGWNVVFDVPVLRAVDSIRRVDPTSIRHDSGHQNSGHWVAVNDQERLQAITGTLGRKAFLPVTGEDRPPLGGLGTGATIDDSEGDDIVTSLLVLIR